MISEALLVAGCSETHARDTNQDRLSPAAASMPYAASLPACLAVADGMGGTEDGAQAAATAVQNLDLLATPSAYLAQHPSRGYPLSQMQSEADLLRWPSLERQALLQHHFNSANQRIIEHAGGPARSGSTLSLLLLAPDAIDIAHLGDSRVYLWRQGQLHLLTQDHNVYGERCKEGLIPFFANQLQLSVEDRLFLESRKLSALEFYYHPGRQEEFPQAPLSYIGQQLAGRIEEQLQIGKISLVNKDKDRLAIALGKQRDISDTPLLPTLPSALETRPRRGDLFLLCTDGLSGVVSQLQLQQRLAQIAARLTETPDLALLDWGCQQLFDDAVQAGSSDNVSILLAYLQHGEDHEYHDQEAPSAGEEPLPDTLPTEEYEQPLSPLLASDLGFSTSPDHDEATPEHHSTEKNTFQDQSVAANQGALTARHYQGVIALLLLALVALGFAYLKQPTPQTSPRPTPPKRTPAPIAAAQSLGLFWVALPSLADAPAHQQRLRWLQKLHRDSLQLRHHLGLHPGAMAPMQKALQARALSHTSFLQTLQKLPREPQDLADFDKGLQAAIAAMWKRIAPTYQRYLDDMREPLALPKSILPAATLRSRRRKLVKRWHTNAASLLRNDWRTPLLLERILHPPMKGDKHKTKAQLKRCIHTLQEAHKRLKAQHPRHALLAPLHNRIQLHQAHLAQ